MPVLIFYYFTVVICGDNLDLWGATKFYYQWVENISELGNGISTIFQTYPLTLANISAPEPSAGFLMYLITRFIDSAHSAIHFVNVLCLIFVCGFIGKSIKNIWLLLLLIITISTGYYEFVLIHMTHRFKIAILFLMVSMYYSRKKKKLADIFLWLSFTAHLSMLFAAPIFLLFRKLNFKNIPKLSFSKYHLIVISSVMLLIAIKGFEGLASSSSTLVEGYDHFKLGMSRKMVAGSGIDTDYFWKLGEEFQWMSFFGVVLIMTILIVLIFLKEFMLFFRGREIIPKKVWVVSLLNYVILSLLFIGTSRLLMVYYIIFSLILVTNFTRLSSKVKLYYLGFFSPLFLYNLANGFYKGPISIIIEELNS